MARVLLSSILFRGGPRFCWVGLMTSQMTSRRKCKYSGSQLGLFPAFTVLANDWLYGELYLDTAARQLRVLTGFHVFPWLVGGEVAAEFGGGKVKLNTSLA